MQETWLEQFYNEMDAEKRLDILNTNADKTVNTNELENHSAGNPEEVDVAFIKKLWVARYGKRKPKTDAFVGYLMQLKYIAESGANDIGSRISAFPPVFRPRSRARCPFEGFEHRSIGQLSGGQLQRALLGRAIISDPAVLILDEPSTYIDKRFEARLYELLAEINKECAIILVSHDIGTVLQQVKSIACVNETLDYHPDTGVTTEWLERNFNCPIELLGHGTLPHRVLGEHHHHH